MANGREHTTNLVCTVDGCPFKDQIESTFEKVILGNGEGSLMSRVKMIETQVDRLSTIVKGEKEGEGLQTHMTEVRTGVRIITWLLLTGISVGLLICALLGLWMHQFSANHPMHQHSQIPVVAMR